MKLIDISTPKHPNSFAMVDDDDFEKINQWKFSRANCSTGLIIDRAKKDE